MRRRNAKNAHERVIARSGLMVLDPASYKGKWKELFNNNNPIYLEIGMGKGKFIIEHAKRRLTYKTYLDMYRVISKGEIEFKTDNRELFEFSLVSLNENNWKFLDLTFDLHKKEEDIITTEYEDKFSAKGNPIYFVRTTYKGD